MSYWRFVGGLLLDAVPLDDHFFDGGTKGMSYIVLSRRLSAIICRARASLVLKIGFFKSSAIKA